MGYYRENKVWIPEYNSSFIVMNAKGKALTWQLTKGISFEQVRTILEDLNNRAHGLIRTANPECVHRQLLQES